VEAVGELKALAREKLLLTHAIDRLRHDFGLGNLLRLSQARRLPLRSIFARFYQLYNRLFLPESLYSFDGPA
jgi:hypothetical protein